jgi:hypothetical protein
MISIDDLRAFALSLPEATEKLTWGEHPTFRVRDKIFVIVGLDPPRASIKATKDAQAALVGSEPETFSPAPHVGRHGWVAVDLARVDSDEARELIEDAWRMTAPKRVVANFDAK